MSPRALVDAAAAAGLSLIAVTDHNCAANCAPVIRLAGERDIAVLPGMEVTTLEEAHVLTLFKGLDEALDFADFIYSRLPDIGNVPLRFGDQVIVDEMGNIEGEVEKYLGMATDLSVDTLLQEASSRGALVIPSHIDRPYAGIIAQLGFLPPLPFDAVEVAWRRNLAMAEGYTAVASSDAHIPELIGTKKTGIEPVDGATAFETVAHALRKGAVTLHYQE